MFIVVGFTLTSYYNILYSRRLLSRKLNEIRRYGTRPAPAAKSILSNPRENINYTIVTPNRVGGGGSLTSPAGGCEDISHIIRIHILHTHYTFFLRLMVFALEIIF